MHFPRRIRFHHKNVVALQRLGRKLAIVPDSGAIGEFRAGILHSDAVVPIRGNHLCGRTFLCKVETVIISVLNVRIVVMGAIGLFLSHHGYSDIFPFQRNLGSCLYPNNIRLGTIPFVERND